MQLGMAFWLSALGDLLIVSLSFLTSQAQDSNEQDMRPLETGAVIARELKGGDAHAYRRTLEPDQYAQVTLEQRGIEVAASLFGPDGKRRTKGWVSGENQVSVSTVADVAGGFTRW